AQFVRWPTVIQQRPTKLSNDEHVRLSRDRLGGHSAVLAHHLERFCPAHAGETARKSDGASERRAVQFNDCHHRQSRPSAGATHLSSCLLFSRSADARTRCCSLLFLRI